MFSIVTLMSGGMFAGFVLYKTAAEVSVRLQSPVDFITKWNIRLLLFLLGFGIGRDSELLAGIPVFGFKGFLIALAGIAGSVAAARLLMGEGTASENINPDSINKDGAGQGGGGKIGLDFAKMTASFVVVFSFIAGLPAGVFFPVMTEVPFDPAEVSLMLLMFLVGFSVGSDPGVLEMIKKYGIKLFLMPVSVIIGTLSAVSVLALLWPSMPLKESLAVGAGFGYYSLSSLVIKEISGDEWAAVALLSNIFREIITLLAAPLLVKIAGPSAPAAAGGATSMDTTLAVTLQYSGKNWVVSAVFSGIVLTVLVPFLVAFILNF